MEKIKIDLDVLLPEIPDERDACVQRIIDVMQRHKGIEKAHIIPADNKNAARLCFHYQPDEISLGQIEGLAREAGAAITGKYGHLIVEVGSIREMMEASVVEAQLKKVRGVIAASVSATGNIRLEFDKTIINKEALLQAVRKEGLKPVSARQTDHGHEGHDHSHEEDDGHDHSHGEETPAWKAWLPAIISFVMLMAGILADNFIQPSFFKGWGRIIWYGIAYLPVGWPVASKGVRLLLKGDLFTEFVLMTIATLGAFYIGEYPEGVAVMLFYTVGELFQDAAVSRARRSIKALLDIRPDTAMVLVNGAYREMKPTDVKVGDTIEVKVGEKVPLDGVVINNGSSFNTAALTGESKPSAFEKGDTVLAGMINQEKVVELQVTKLFNDSSLARILTMVQEATTRKAKTEQFIRRFARIYTPVVVFLAIGIALLPYFFVDPYVFNDWLYRSLIFLVISCPCALVISIPLGYFGGIGAASRKGILFKGSNYLDLITRVNQVVMDKTGTLTKGVFRVQEVRSFDLRQEDWLPLAAALESKSTHPIATAVVEFAKQSADGVTVDGLQEISGHGLKGNISGKTVLAGNAKLLKRERIPVPAEVESITDTIVVVGVDGKFAGYVTIADEIKEDAKDAVDALHAMNIQTTMLSGDKQSVVNSVAGILKIDHAYGDLLPENKVEKVEQIKKTPDAVIAFVGDGINDAPVLALSDVGIAMGGLGSDAAIETADVVIQTDQPSRIATAIKIGKATRRIVWQNIGLAFGVKAIVLVLGAGGLATMWEAVFADVGVALLAIVNAIRIQRMKF
ncbi:heavy metal translocating P-type ATPase [Chitinophaga cymbidii]|uniref:P-type Zn(2+) transporter n=1 Tax=Chitinophaga cymbidii TaxID=1096750 RepID=A0A512RLL2_9BACT|nr:heavy metal translocating P-type ATPase [Chitinophaga cymbidii]GEP96591.1 cadmium/zinc/cobalt-transporting ATPase [Chitinophaga cymbidii]